jgi:pantetheine-phosphate adenylyltransferase/dephospho-CoA kinase
MTKVLIPGSFDLIHNGHLDIIKRTAELFDGDLIVGMGKNLDKKTTFSVNERMEIIRKSLSAYPELSSRVNVVSFDGLAVDYAYEHMINAIAKGIRDDKDFDYERMLYDIGESQKLGIETILFFSKKEFSNISSSSIKALQKEQGLVHDSIPLYVKQCLEARLSGQHIMNLTGSIGVGKSRVSSKLEEIGKQHGIPVYHIELDHIPHHMYDGTYKEPIYAETRKKIIETFGKDLEMPDETINRKKLGEIVFNDPQKLEKLNEIVNKPMMVKLRREMYGKKGLILVNAALTAELNMAYLSNNNVVLVTTDRQSQERRLKERNFTEEQVKRRLDSQYTTERKKEMINRAISEQKQGRLWEIDNSDGLDPQLDVLFDEMIEYIDQYGQLRFMGLWKRIDADGTSDSEYERLVDTYLQPHRVYHSLSHIVSGLSDIARVRHLMENPDQVLFAWFYHDYVYRERSNVNEEESAKVAYNVCKNARLPEVFAESVRNLILATRHHGDIPVKNIDEGLIIDTDLAIFGKPTEEFDKYEEGIREEYEWADPDEFKTRRTYILERFLKRPHIYCTEFFRQLYECQARDNLKQSLEKLKGN